MTDRVAASLDLARLSARLASGELTALALIEDVLGRIAAAGDDKVWITRVRADELRARAAALDAKAAREPELRRRLPLFGVPFAVKDNIDVAGLSTTAACPDFAYVATATAPAVARLEAAGALLVGKTNLDQFATGLVGCRSPYGVPRNPFDARYIPGGSSSGSAVAVAAGLVSFALGTDTAGSGRVPAAFNNIVGLKPTRGMISTQGVVPACRSLDCVSIFALSCDDAQEILGICTGFDPEDPLSRPMAQAPARFPTSFRFAVPRPSDLDFFGDVETPSLFAAAATALEKLGGVCKEVDFGPFRDAAEMLYRGPWVAERLVATEKLLKRNPEALLPVTREIIASGAQFTALDAFKASYRLAALRRAAETQMGEADILLLPTAGTSYAVAEVEATPMALNTNLGRYTNFVNLFDQAAVAIPAGFRGDGLPFGVCLVGRAHSDAALLKLGAALHRHLDLPLGATTQHLPPASPLRSNTQDNCGRIEIAVAGAHLTGMPLNGELLEQGGRFVRHHRTAPIYRMFLLNGEPARPGLVRDPTRGRSIEIEIWSLSVANFGSFIAAIPAPLTIGTLALDGGDIVKGFLCEADGVRDAEDISDFGGWRQFLAQRRR